MSGGVPILHMWWACHQTMLAIVWWCAHFTHVVGVPPDYVSCSLVVCPLYTCSGCAHFTHVVGPLYTCGVPTLHMWWASHQTMLAVVWWCAHFTHVVGVPTLHMWWACHQTMLAIVWWCAHFTHMWWACHQTMQAIVWWCAHFTHVVGMPPGHQTMLRSYSLVVCPLYTCGGHATRLC